MKIKMNPKTELIQKEYGLLVNQINFIKKQNSIGFFTGLSNLQKNNLDKLTLVSINSLIERFQNICNFVLNEAFFENSKNDYKNLKIFVIKKLTSLNEIN